MAGFAAGDKTPEQAGAGTGRGDSNISEWGGARFIRARMKNGRRICIKYPLEQKNEAGGQWRKMLAGLSGQAFLQPLPPIAPQERNLLEVDKLRAFRAAGLPAADILAVQDGFSVYADMGENVAQVLATLRGRDTALHDRLLAGIGGALGQIHAADLCLGRPELRYMFLAAHGVGVSGFADYPERTMPAAAAQLRDIWQLLELVADRAVAKDSALAAAFLDWRRQAGLETLEGLRRTVRGFRRRLGPYKILTPLFFGKARHNQLRVLQFLIANVGV